MDQEKKQHQKPLTIDEQINNLKELGLVINDEDKAKELLNDISYFRLIKAYSIGLKPKNGKYDSNVSFDQIVELYMFNADFRQLLFAEIEQIEVNLRCRVGNYFSKKHGVFGYRDASLFRSEEYFNQIIDDVDKEINRNSNSPFIRNFKDNYEPADIPFYAAVEVFSFGTLSKFFKNMKNEDKSHIARDYGIRYVFLESWFESLSYVRNLCAHYGRLYNAKLAKTPNLYKDYKKHKIPNNKIFGILCCMKHLLPSDEEWTNFVDSIEKLFAKYPSVDKTTMGFPKDWKQVLL